MIELNWSDVVSVLNTCKPYFIGFGIVAVLAIIVMIACSKMPKPQKGLIRGEALIAIMLALLVIVNLICTGPMSTLIGLVTSGGGAIPDEITNATNEHTREIAREGIVMLENNGLLPLEKGKKVNVFGWASVNPLFGGSGAGALNDLYPKTSLIEGLKNAGFSVNEDLTKFYTDFGGARAAYGQDWSLPEPTAESYGDLINSAKTFSDTAIMVVARWGGEGSDVPKDMTQAVYTNNSPDYADFQPGQTYLELSQTEKNVLDMICANFENVIFVYDGMSSFVFSFLKDYPQIKSVLLCDGPGQTGFDALGEILNGTVNPSGRTVDTYLYDLKAAPWWNNFGGFSYDNMPEFAVDASDPYMGGTTPTFVNIVENIYVGYKYYETAAAEGIIDYDATVQYPFGYGLSYTTFSQEITNMKSDNGVITFDVVVKNTGNVAGKDVVQVYADLPYTNGGIEKASANLIAFDKTDIIEPGKEQTISFTIKDDYLASFDDKTNGCYVLEAGDYTISINADSHNRIDSFLYTVGSTIVYNGSNTHNGDLVAAVNLFEDAKGEVTYLSRANHFANLAEATAEPSLTMPASQKDEFIWTYNYKMEQNPDATVPTIGAKNGASLTDLRGKDYNDPAWEPLLDQLTIDEMQDMIAHAGFQTAPAPSVGKVQTIDADGPSALSNNFTGAGSVGFPSAVLMASTWNEDMAWTYGNDMGKMAAAMDISGWYAPSANIHRTALGGRNYEYFSEDSLICGKLSAQAIKGAAEEGVYGYMKHYAMNEQETNRWAMICTWSTEQAIREIYLKPFEICVKEGNARAVMSSFNYIGGRWAGGHKQLLTDVLRNEWGFQGFVETDYFAGAYDMNADQMLEAGGACCLSTFDIGTNFASDTTGATSLQYMRRACHDILFTVVNSQAYASEVSMGMASWMKLLIGADVVVGVILVATEVLVIKRFLKRKKA